MSLNCETVMDLVSLYKDGAVSDGTRQTIDEHLRDCRDCRRYYHQYDSIDRIITKKQEDASCDVEEKYASFSASLKRRRTIAAAGLAFCAAITLCSVTFALLATRRRTENLKN